MSSAGAYDIADVVAADAENNYSLGDEYSVVGAAGNPGRAAGNLGAVERALDCKQVLGWEDARSLRAG